MKRILVLLALLVSGCQEEIEEFDSALADDERIQAKWQTLRSAAEKGDAKALATLDAAFESTKDEREKEHLALILSWMPSADPKYHRHSVALARQVIEEDAPFPNRIYPWSQEPSHSLTGEFKQWCAERKISTGACFERVLLIYPMRMVMLDERDIPLLVQALKARNFAVAQSAAENLSGLKRLEAVPHLVAAAKRMPQPYRIVTVGAIADFDTPATWKHVEELEPDPDIVMSMRADVARDAEEERELAAKKP